MNIIRKILLVCPAFLASLLLLANPAQAQNIQTSATTQVVLVSSVQTQSEFTVPHLKPASDPILDQVGCGCARCVQNNFELLQGKLPIIDL
ncbi:MAG TPA: hypothetical protein VK203_08040 [Nostocaceae cyanobacterium]|nr:hypothetical protein [Nostocaceae cyanobacterium]